MNFLRYYIYYIFLHLTLAGSSFIQIGDAVTVNLDTSVSYKHSSNILKSEANEEKSDGISIFSPGVVFNFGKPGTVLDFNIMTNYDIIKYRDYSGLDINRFKMYLNGSYNPSAIFNSSFSYSSVETQSAISELDTKGAPALVETTSDTSSFNGTYKYSPKLSFSLGVNQTDTKYDTYQDQLSPRKSTTIPLKLIYQYSDKLSVLYGVSFTESKISSRKAYFPPLGTVTLAGYETDSIYYNIGLSGQILPKLSGTFDVGYRTLEFSTSTDDFNSFGATSALSWMVSPKFRTSINISRDFDFAGSGSTYRYTRGYISSVYTINSEYRLSFNIGRSVNYYKSNKARQGEEADREATWNNFSTNLYYIPSKNYSFSAGYNYVRSDAVSDYVLKEYLISATIKY